MTLNDNKRLVVARQMGVFLRKHPGKPFTMDEVFKLASANTTPGIGGKKYILQRSGICRKGGGEIKSLSDPDWNEVWMTLDKLRREGFVLVTHTPKRKYKYDPLEDKSVKQVLTPQMAKENLRAQIAAALVELVYEEGAIEKDKAKAKICERFGYSDIKHTLWGPLVSRCTRGGVGGRKIVIDRNENIYTVPELLDAVDEVTAKAEEVLGKVTKMTISPSELSISTKPDGTTTITLDDGTTIVRNPNSKTIEVKPPQKGWQVIVSSLLSLL